MKTKQVTHTLYPVSYINEDGTQRDVLYNFKPIGKDYLVGLPIEMVTEHPATMSDEHHQATIEHHQATIEHLERKLAALKGETNEEA